MNAHTPAQAGARWLRCDLHVHTPFDSEKKFGEDRRGAVEASERGDYSRLAAIAGRLVEACGSAGMDLVALTDHNSVEGYRRLKPLIDATSRQSSGDPPAVPTFLPGVELSVGSERTLHLLLVFASDTDADEIQALIAYVLAPLGPFDAKTGAPQASGESVGQSLDRIYEYARPPSGERNLRFVLLPAHAEASSGLWKEMAGDLRRRVATRTDWNGFHTKCSFSESPEVLRDLLLRWRAAKDGREWDSLDQDLRSRYRRLEHWPLIEASDPERYEAVGSRYTWLKMESADIEGIRLALLDPESRLRRADQGPPRSDYPRITSIRIRGTDFFDDVCLPFNPCLTTIIGGRGSGKSTIIEYLRHGLGRSRPEDLPDDDPNGVRRGVESLLGPKEERDAGQTPGTLLAEHEIAVDIVVAESAYGVRRTASGLEVLSDPDDPFSELAVLDVRSLIAPRVLSQRQIAHIAREAASQRAELDALIDPDRMREMESDLRSAVDALAALQVTRRRLEGERSKLPAVETELKKVRDQISYLEGTGRKETLECFDAFDRERRWLEDVQRETTGLAQEMDETAGAVEAAGAAASPPRGTPSAASLEAVSERLIGARRTAAGVLRTQAGALRDALDAVRHEQAAAWQAGFDQARTAYEALRAEMASRGVDFSQHAKLLQKRALLEREHAELVKATQQLETIGRRVQESRAQLLAVHGRRLEARLDRARALEEAGADVRLEVRAYQDRADFAERREDWFGGAGLREQDWGVLCDYVFAEGAEVPRRIADLVAAIRADVEATVLAFGVDADDSQVAHLVGRERLSGHFYRALGEGERMRLDEIERFVPEDKVDALVREHDGAFKPITTGSVGQKSTAILSLLLSAGDEPLIIDQPEDDLDNQYVYNVVVELLRRRKFRRQIIMATHNANIPVNGDAELIIALGVKDGLGYVEQSGNIDRPEVKEAVSRIMEGSAEAFRLRRERYGY